LDDGAGATTPGAQFGEHTDNILRELGVDDGTLHRSQSVRLRHLKMTAPRPHTPAHRWRQIM